jgi:hypothetical protein
VANNVTLDLSGQSYIRVAEGVTILGGRDAHTDGPLLFTKTLPRTLFIVDGDGVRIRGLRIRGRDLGVPSSGNTSGILSNSNQRLEIDNNEISGWRHAAVELRDSGKRISHLGTPTIRVHDNYIHHNQRIGKDGYGVAMYSGAYALIERNVFDWNRHAITGADGSNESGFRAYDNLVLQHGGKHRWIPFPGFWVHTHQFDMHGQKHCGAGSVVSSALYNCGTAGHNMEIRNNSFLYTETGAIKLRGTPQRKPCGMNVYDNVFRHAKLINAMSQTESGLCQGNNQFGVNSLSSIRKCDVDGNGVVDNFLATGRTWWFASGTKKHWTFVKRSRERPTSCPPPPPPPPPVANPRP